MISNNTGAISMKQILLNTKEVYLYVKKQWISVFIISFIGGLIGFLYGSFQPITYIAKTTFILEESKSANSGLGGLASIAGQFGMDLGSGSGGGILAGDNILVYFKSPSLAKEVLLTKFNSKSELLIADVYANTYGYKKVWLEDDKIGDINFIDMINSNSKKRLYDSLLNDLTDIILSKQFNVMRPDKKASFIEVSVTMLDELLAKVYCDRIVQTVVGRYLTLKTQRQKSTVDKLQARADSISNLLQLKTYSGASLQSSTSTMDLNPLYKTKTSVAMETTLRDKTLLAAIFANVTQNLEMAKFTLSQETPIIQIIDAPNFPLKKEKVSKIKIALVFSGLFLFITLIYIIIRRYLSKFNI
jgi:hypothetical protein